MLSDQPDYPPEHHEHQDYHREHHRRQEQHHRQMLVLRAAQAHGAGLLEKFLRGIARRRRIRRRVGWALLLAGLLSAYGYVHHRPDRLARVSRQLQAAAYQLPLPVYP